VALGRDALDHDARVKSGERHIFGSTRFTICTWPDCKRRHAGRRVVHHQDLNRIDEADIGAPVVLVLGGKVAHPGFVLGDLVGSGSNAASGASMPPFGWITR